MKQDIVIFGAGGFGREVMWMLETANKKSKTWRILGFVDDTPKLQETRIQKHRVLGTTKWLLSQKKPLCVLCCIGDSTAREKVIRTLTKNPRLRFPAFIAPGVICPPSLVVGNGTIICSSAVITVNVTIGTYVIINYHATVCHDSIIEDFVSIYPSVNISGFVHVGTSTHVGVGAQILPHVSVGSHTIIGAGAVVTKDLPSGCVAVGIPAKPIRQKKKA